MGDDDCSSAVIRMCIDSGSLVRQASASVEDKTHRLLPSHFGQTRDVIWDAWRAQSCLLATGGDATNILCVCGTKTLLNVGVMYKGRQGDIPTGGVSGDNSSFRI